MVLSVDLNPGRMPEGHLRNELEFRGPDGRATWEWTTVADSSGSAKSNGALAKSGRPQVPSKSVAILTIENALAASSVDEVGRADYAARDR